MNPAEWIETPAARFPSAPLWHPAEKCIYWSDIETCRLYRYSPERGETETVLDDGHPVGAIVLRPDGALLLFRDRGNVVAFRDGAVTETVVPPLADHAGTRYSAAAMDKAGRIVCATLSGNNHFARLFLLDAEARLLPLREFIGTPAGLAFAEFGAALLLSNSHPTAAGVLRFAYDANAEMPLPGGPEPFINCLAESPKRGNAPCGIVARLDGTITVAHRGSSTIAIHGRRGDRTGVIRLSVRSPIGLCYGGETLADLYITTAGGHRKLYEGAHAGELAVVRGFGPAFG